MLHSCSSQSPTCCLIWFFYSYPKNFTKNWKEVGVESHTPSKVNQTTAAESFNRVEQILCTFSRSFLSLFIWTLGFSGGSDGKESACNVGDSDSTPGLGISHDGNGNPLQCCCLASGQRSLVGYSPWGCKESDMTEWLNTFWHEAAVRKKRQGQWVHTSPWKNAFRKKTDVVKWTQCFLFVGFVSPLGIRIQKGSVNLGNLLLLLRFEYFQFQWFVS